jgi:hypothetical protein
MSDRALYVLIFALLISTLTLVFSDKELMKKLGEPGCSNPQDCRLVRTQFR